MLKAFDSPLDPKEFGVKGTVADTLLDDIDPEIQLGVTPYKGHPQPMVNRLSTLASDVQDQLNEAAEILVQEPDNALSAITFDKLKAVQNIILGQLTRGQPSSESLAQLARMDFTAITDRGGLENVSDAIRDLYIVTTKNGELSVDTRIPVEQAKMLSNIDDPAAQTKFLREISLVEEASGIPQLQAKLQGMRKTASQIIKDNCGV
jgi:antitoxin component of RelBE/YafQ-DinJ toxin-antitoxin module